jgi:hypothetical protein
MFEDIENRKRIILSIPNLLSLNNNSLSKYKSLRIRDIYISLKEVYFFILSYCFVLFFCYDLSFML